MTEAVYEKNVVDSSGWLEYLAGTSNGSFFEKAIHDTDNLLVPTICIYEVFKRMMLQLGEQAALNAAGVLFSRQIVEISAEIALNGAQLSIQHKLPMADSLILAVARAHNAILWTQDEHFKGLERVQYTAKPGSGG